MFSGSPFVVLLVVLVSQGQSSTAVSSITATLSVPPTVTMSIIGTSEKPTSSSERTQGQSSTAVTPSVTANATSSVQSSTVTVVNGHSSITPTTKPIIAYTVCILRSTIDSAWNEDYGKESSETYKNASKEYSSALEKCFEKHMDVNVSDVTFKNKAGRVFAEAKLRLVFKEEEDSRTISVIFITKVDSGKLSENLQVIKGSGEVEDVGISYKNYKAKEGECEKCDGAGGPFEIEGECVPDSKEFSCNGVEKKKTKKTEECTTYCSSTALTVSSLVLAIGILLSSSFQ